MDCEPLFDKELVDDFLKSSNNQSEGEYYSSSEEYFIDCCRGNYIEDIKQILETEPELDLEYVDNNINNCIHMVAANGHLQLF